LRLDYAAGVRFTVCAHTAYPLQAEVKPEVYNAGIPMEVQASSAREAARIACDRQRAEWEAEGSVGQVGTFRYAVIGWDNYSYGPTVELVEVEIKAVSTRVAEVETVLAAA
jgi:hypothetical protein